MVFSKRSHEGYLMVDHRASPGLPREYAERRGLNPRELGEGGLFEAPTLGCPHCGSVVVMNPDRKRERAHCIKCDSYICDWCEARRHEPDYEHITMAQVRDMVGSGRYRLAPGSTAVRPILVPTGLPALPKFRCTELSHPGAAPDIAIMGSPSKLLTGATSNG